eukprot:346199-Pleurochrysis_carterae.AAC.2
MAHGQEGFPEQHHAESASRMRSHADACAKKGVGADVRACDSASQLTPLPLGLVNAVPRSLYWLTLTPRGPRHSAPALAARNPPTLRQRCLLQPVTAHGLAQQLLAIHSHAELQLLRAR